MNILKRPIAVLFLLLSCTVLFFSCEDPDELGIELLDDGQLVELIYTDSVQVNVAMKMQDTVSSSALTKLVFGYHNDPYLGPYWAAFYSKMNIAPKDSIDFLDQDGNKALFDSLIFKLKIDYLIGDTTSPMKVEVFRVSETIYDSVDYKTNSSLEYLPTPIGSAIFPDDFDDSLRYLNIKMSDDFSAELWSKGGQAELYTQENFEEYFKGIYVKVTPLSNGGSIMGTNILDDRTGILLYYHYYKPGTDSEIDTVNKTVGIGFAKRINTYQNDLSGHPYLSSLSPYSEINSDVTDNVCYLQGGTNILPRITFPHLDKFAENRNLLINKAELFLSPLPNTIDGQNPPPSKLRMLISDENGYIDEDESGAERVLTVEGAASQILGWDYNSGGQSFSPIDITSYIQDVVKGNTANNGLILRSSDYTTSMNRLLFGNQKNSQGMPIKLKIYYTLAKE